MPLNKKQRQRLLQENCRAISDDDAIDPRHYFYNKRKSKSKFRKVYQLCRQIRDTLQLTLADNEPQLQELSVIEVVPAPDARRVLVLLQWNREDLPTAAEVEQLMKLLAAQIPRLRYEIAQSINRSKTPQLTFELSQLYP